MSTFAVFLSASDLELAVRLARESGLHDFDPVTPFAVDRIIELTPKERERSRYGAFLPNANVLGLLTLTGGVAGMCTGFGMQWLANSWAQPMSAGGRPFFSWPNYIPITFVLSILFAASTLFLSFFLIIRLPEPHHPYFDVPEFQLDRNLFYLFFPGVIPATAIAKFKEKVPSVAFGEIGS